MPIGDLLAEISGGQSSSAPPAKAPPSSGVKRKAEDDANSTTSTKLAKARQPDGSYPSSKVNRNAQGEAERSNSISRPAKTAPLRNATNTKPDQPHRTSSPSTNGRPYQPPTPGSQRGLPSSNGRPVPRPSGTSLQKQSSNLASRPKLSSSAIGASKVPPARPSPTTPTTSDPSRAPKKGSFAEIMARGAKVQQTMGKVGMIQHKAIDKGSNKKERDVVKPEQKPGTKGKAGQPYLGNGRPSATSARDASRSGGGPSRDAPRNGPAKDMKAGTKQRPGSSGGESQEKKMKKSATATTGYTGTARPRPGAKSSKASSSKSEQRPKPSPVGGLLAPPRAGRRDRYEDEYDDELDDFIEYDDEEDDPNPRGHGYGYDSEGSSDMEAGMSDIDDEERAAERVAREEDKRELALEEKLRREKEERKRRWTQGR